MGLGIGLTAAKEYHIPYYPETISNLELWLRFNKGYTAHDGSTTTTNDMSDGDKIRRWDDYSVNDNDAEQAEDTAAPKYLSGGSEFVSNNKWFDLTSSIVLEEAFTLIMRVTLTSVSSDSLFGSGNQNFVRIMNENTIRCKVGNATQNNFTATDALDAGDSAPEYIISFTRNAGNEMQILVDGGDFTQHQWGGLSVSNGDTFTIDNVGAHTDDAGEMGGIVRDVLIYSKYLTNTELSNMYTYLRSQ